MLIAFDPGAFGGTPERFAVLAAAIEAQPGARLPGARRLAAREKAAREGVAVSEALLAQIAAVCT